MALTLGQYVKRWQRWAGAGLGSTRVVPVAQVNVASIAKLDRSAIVGAALLQSL